MQHDARTSSEQDSDEHWKDVAKLLWHGQLDTFSEEEQTAIAKSLRSNCPEDIVSLLGAGEFKSSKYKRFNWDMQVQICMRPSILWIAVRNAWEQAADGNSLKQRSASSRQQSRGAACDLPSSAAPAVEIGAPMNASNHQLLELPRVQDLKHHIVHCTVS